MIKKNSKHESRVKAKVTCLCPAKRDEDATSLATRCQVTSRTQHQQLHHYDVKTASITAGVGQLSCWQSPLPACHAATYSTASAAATAAAAYWWQQRRCNIISSYLCLYFYGWWWWPMSYDYGKRNKKANIRWQDSAPPISGYWPTSEPNAG